MKNPINAWLYKNRKRIQLSVLLMQFVIVLATFARLPESKGPLTLICKPDLFGGAIICTELQ